ncbi:hypothetical protein TNCV_1873521 [Trichonephila clavipes]|nr:hypothetical protein TNCV_1873521 [Trichonephila clavipes]
MFAVANEMPNRLDEVTTYQQGRYISGSVAPAQLAHPSKPCSIYTVACQVLVLLEDDSHWYQAMEEAAVSQSPAQLRNLFAILVAV